MLEPDELLLDKPPPASAASCSVASTATKPPTASTTVSAVPAASVAKAPPPHRRPLTGPTRSRVIGTQQSPAICDVRHVYEACPLFWGCSSGFLTTLQELGGDRITGTVYDAGTTLAKEGEPSRSLYIIHRGIMEVLHKEERQGLLQTGECTGEGALLGTETRHRATLRTLTMCHIYEITNAAFMRALMTHRMERQLFRHLRNNRSKSQMGCQSGRSSSEDANSPSSRRGPTSPSNKIVNAMSALAVAKKGVDEAMKTQPTLPLEGLPPPSEEREKLVLPRLLDGAEIDSLTPRWWRGRMPRATTAEDQAFIDQLQGSLRHDARCGFLVPSISSDVAAHADLNGERSRAADVPLDLNLLPPLSAMSPLQKRAVERQLQIRVHARRRLRKAARSLLPAHFPQRGTSNVKFHESLMPLIPATAKE